jgi:hypothetical protein
VSEARSPREILDEVGRRLEDAAAGRTTRRLRVPGRLVVVVAAVALLCGGTATATRSIWAPDAPSTRSHGPTAVVGSGEVAGTRFALDARGCPGGGISVVVRTGTGGAATACRSVGGRPGLYADPRTGAVVAFGTASPRTIAVEGPAGDGRVLRAPGEVERRASLPPVAYYIVPVRSVADAGRLVFSCSGAPCGR